MELFDKILWNKGIVSNSFPVDLKGDSLSILTSLKENSIVDLNYANVSSTLCLFALYFMVVRKPSLLG